MPDTGCLLCKKSQPVASTSYVTSILYLACSPRAHIITSTCDTISCSEALTITIETFSLYVFQKVMEIVTKYTRLFSGKPGCDLPLG